MATYLAFLRAINLGANRKFPAGELHECLRDGGYEGAETHINTGNVRLTSTRRSRERVEGDLESLFLANRGFEIPTIVFTPEEFAGIAADTRRLDAPQRGAPPARHYVSLLRHAPTADGIAAVQVQRLPTIELRVMGRAIHFLVSHDHPLGGVDVTATEKLVGVSTNRNANVIKAIAAKWCD